MSADANRNWKPKEKAPVPKKDQAPTFTALNVGIRIDSAEETAEVIAALHEFLRGLKELYNIRADVQLNIRF